MQKKTLIVLLILGIICGIGTSECLAQANPTALKNKKITLDLKDKPLGIVFLHLMVKFDVPIGMEGSTLDNDHMDYVFNPNLPYKIPGSKLGDGTYRIEKHLLTIQVENAGLETVLDEIVRQLKNYKWEINDEVVNIIPTKGRDSRYEKLLGTKIGNFKFEKDFIIGQIRNDILDLPEVRSFLVENKIFSTKRRDMSVNSSRHLPFEMNFSNLTFRDLLNKITKLKRGGWFLRKSYLWGSDEKEFIEINI